MKKTMIASLAVLASAAVVATFALGGAGKFGDVQVHADPVEYSVTFDENASYQEVAIDARTYYVFHATTDNGNSVGVVGGPTVLKRITFKDVQFMMLALFDWNSALTSVGAYQFSTITGFKIDYTGGELTLSRNEYPDISNIISGEKYDAPCTPSNTPVFTVNGSINVSSLTIYYSC